MSQQHLLGIINDILNFSRVEAGHVSYEARPVSLGAVIDTVTPMVAPQARVKGVTLRSEPCPQNVVATADRPKVEQILLNLLSNAIKFTPDGGSVRVCCSADEEAVRLTVHDTGIGIPSDQIEAIFTPFVQVGRGLANPKEGTGLGLSISRELARGMHGDLAATSEVGVGSTFTLMLPRGAAEAALAHQ